jgi:hypothetical protein
MSTHVDVTAVDAILLADGWHSVEAASFTVDVVEYVRDERHCCRTAAAMRRRRPSRSTSAVRPADASRCASAHRNLGDPVTATGRPVSEQLALFDHPHDELAARRRRVVAARLAELDLHSTEDQDEGQNDDR